MPLLVGIDGAVRCAELGAGARFHLDENELVPIPSDQIDFPRPRSRPVITRDNPKTAAAKKAMRKVLPATASGEVRMPAAPAGAVADAVGETVQERDHVRSK